MLARVQGGEPLVGARTLVVEPQTLALQLQPHLAETVGLAAEGVLLVGDDLTPPGKLLAVGFQLCTSLLELLLAHLELRAARLERCPRLLELVPGRSHGVEALTPRQDII